MTDRLDIDNSSLFDNVEEQQIEFSGEVDGDEYQFAVQYDVLEALSGDAPEDDALDLFNQFVDPISDAALAALARDTDQTIVIVSENDLG
ncbi:DUF1488 family protein [Sphingomonas sp.]|jgi:hypothetical protein|uniref:DUF1488 family protein n=1 Tax=Sphingomonas sp. TaxID=28214 RepID=UPI002D7F2DD8|nr:DUF1488 family protein [Sphingomonas sp.]HEU0043171.1 DUF1488 family protein [Sphingomonas sp.]